MLYVIVLSSFIVLACLWKRLLFVEQTAEVMELADADEPQADLISPDTLHQMISELSVGYRTVINLYVFVGYSH
jgi:hypothetical protein